MQWRPADCCYPNPLWGGVRDNLNDGELAKQVNTNTKNISVLNTNLTATVSGSDVPFKFTYDATTGSYGYKDGADTFCPFKSGFNTILDDGPVFIFRLYIGECTWLKDGVLSIGSPAAVSDYLSCSTGIGANLRNNKVGTYRYYITDSGGSSVANSSTLLATEYTEVTFTTTGNYIGSSFASSTTACYIVQYVEK